MWKVALGVLQKEKCEHQNYILDSSLHTLTHVTEDGQWLRGRRDEGGREGRQDEEEKKNWREDCLAVTERIERWSGRAKEGWKRGEKEIVGSFFRGCF